MGAPRVWDQWTCVVFGLDESMLNYFGLVQVCVLVCEREMEREKKKEKERKKIRPVSDSIHVTPPL